MIKALIFLLVSGQAFAMVIGTDTRDLLNTPAQLPYSAVGMIETFDGQVCTGALVARDVVLTAAHCLIRDNKFLTPGQIRYHAHYLYGASVGDMSGVVDMKTAAQVTPNESTDWALLRLKKTLGDHYGFLATAPLGAEYMHKALLRVPGYDITHPISKNSGISLVVNKTRGHSKMITSTGLILHDVPTGPGSSGGPLLREMDGGWSIVGITVAEIRRGIRCPVFNKRDCHNIAVPEASWREALESFRR